MKERPILFTGPMVRAILDGSKTQTRRELKVRGWQAAMLRTIEFVHVLHGAAARVLSCAQPVDTAWAGFKLSLDSTSPAYFKCPYGQPGDRLWVRETWYQRGEWRLPCFPGADADDAYWAETRDVVYAASAQKPVTEHNKPAGQWRSRPSIHMPRWASRILLEVVSVRVERLQDISEADCWAEGIEAVDGALDDMKIIDLAKRMGRCIEDAAPTYAALWESINGAGSWDANPWVWVVEFKRVTP